MRSDSSCGSGPSALFLDVPGEEQRLGDHEHQHEAIAADSLKFTQVSVGS